jgi:hypothetical protein
MTLLKTKNVWKIAAALICILILKPSAALAEKTDPLQLGVVCKKEVAEFCTRITDPNSPALFKCLLEHKAETSPDCQKQLSLAPVDKLPRPPQKNAAGFAVLGALGLLPTNTTKVSYGGWITPDSSGGIEQHRAAIQTPVYQGDGKNISVSLSGSSLHFGEAPVLSGSGTVLSQDLWKVELGASFSQKLEDDKFEGARISIGSASDRPFDGLGVTTIGASAFYSWPGTERSRWMLTLFFSNNNPILNYVPIPGFIYLYQTDTFIGMFGFPFTSIIWTPIRPWMFTLSIFGPTVVSEVAFGNPRGVQIFTGYNYTQQSYLRESRPDANDRIYYNEMHTPIGVRFPLFGLKSELSTGYAFDRSIYEGSHFGKRDGGNEDIGHSWYYAWNLGLEL